MKDGECLKWEELEVFKVGSRLWLGDDSSVAVRFPESAIQCIQVLKVVNVFKLLQLPIGQYYFTFIYLLLLAAIRSQCTFATDVVQSIMYVRALHS